METTTTEQTSLSTETTDRRLRIGSLLVGLVGIVYAVLGIVTVRTPMRGEEALAGMTFAELQATNPAVADTVWHLNAGIGAIVVGIGVLFAFLAWHGLANGSRLAWYSVAILAVTFVGAILVAHVPVGHPSVSHWGPPLVATLVLLSGLAITAKPVFSATAPPDPDDRVP